MAKVTGWLKLHRKIRDWEFFTNPECVQLLVYLLCEADEEGCITTTIEQICSDLHLTRQVVRDRLKKLCSTNTSTIKSTNKQTCITLCNFTSYNGEKSKVNQQTNQYFNQQEKEKVSPTPPLKENNKEKYSSSTTMRAREEFIQALKGDRTWGEAIEMRYILPPGSLGKWIDDFSLDIQCRDVVHKDIQDAKRHFFDWLRIQLRYEQRTTTTSKAGYLQAERERLQREIAELNENYIRQHPGEFPNDV